MRLLAIGDVHGYTDALRSLLAEVRPEPSDTLVFLGDYVDNGPDVAGTLEWVSKLSRDHGWVFLRGNHDQMLLDAYRDPSKLVVWGSLSGDGPLASYGPGTTAELLPRVPEDHIEFLENRCCDFYETDAFICVHGGIRSHVAPADEEKERLQWMVLSSSAAHLSGRTVVCGHTSQANGKIADFGHTICIDSGITKGGYLSCLDMGDYSYTQASADGKIRKGVLRSPERQPWEHDAENMIHPEP